ncbi:MAG: pyridoxamine kinase [Sphaerochaetaceae bacterium]
MDTMKTVAAIHDLSCYAKSSLTVVIPTLAAMGVEAAVLPTALLSTQTDGFENYYYQDLSESMVAITAHWKQLGLRFDGIYSGFLGSQTQIGLVSDFIDSQRALGNPLVLVDPVLGDDGATYGPITAILKRRMLDLVRKADVITPNVTEAALLLDEPYHSDLSQNAAVEWAKRLSDLGPTQVAITSVMHGSGGAVVSYDRHKDTHSSVYQTYAPVSYPGSGDLFASILCALLVKGTSFLDASAKSAHLVSEAVFASWRDNVEIRHGVSVELITSLLAGV